MMFKTLAVIALCGAAAAHPRRHEHKVHKHQAQVASGSGNLPIPTGGAYPQGNSTYHSGNSTRGCKSGRVKPTAVMSTVTVLPVAAAESTVDTAVLAVVSSSAACGLASTTTITSTDIVTVTVTPSESPASSADVSTAIAAVVSSSATEEAAAVEPTVASSAAPSSAESVADTSVVEAAPAPATSAAEVATSSIPTVAAGGFYQASSVAASSSAASTSTAPSSGSSGMKRGLAYNDAGLTSAFAGKAGWAYNWASKADGTLPSGVEYVPMLWGEKKFSSWTSDADAALGNGATHLLSFNEPDLGAQAAMTPGAAAAAHITHMNPYSGKASIGSPSVTNGGNGMGLDWLSSFFSSCGGQCKVDFLTFHWYDSAKNVAYFKQHVQNAIDLAAKNGVSKVWLTEFGASGSDSEVASFLGEVLPWLESQSAVERYAYFMCSNGVLVNNGAISSPIGTAYAS